jgi:hypothetical protein
MGKLGERNRRCEYRKRERGKRIRDLKEERKYKENKLALLFNIHKK